MLVAELSSPSVNQAYAGGQTANGTTQKAAHWAAFFRWLFRNSTPLGLSNRAKNGVLMEGILKRRDAENAEEVLQKELSAASATLRFQFAKFP